RRRCCAGPSATRSAPTASSSAAAGRRRPCARTASTSPAPFPRCTTRRCSRRTRRCCSVCEPGRTLPPGQEGPTMRLPPSADDDHGWLDEVRHDLLRRLLALAILAALLLSPRLWLSAREFPLTPLFDWLPAVPAPFDQLWFVALMLQLVLVTCVRPPRWLLPAFLVLSAALALFDQMRW